MSAPPGVGRRAGWAMTPPDGVADDAPVVEADGATVGEAKWNALKALERDLPGIEAGDVEFEVLGEHPDDVRVRARADVASWKVRSAALPDEPVERIRSLLARVVSQLELRASVDVEETDDEIRATVNGDDLGLLIGRHGSTIDALQHLAARAAFRGELEHRRVVVDAAGYRERREAQLRRAADQAVDDAISFGRPVELDPMTAGERKTVHNYLKDRTEIDTHSEGDEPERRLVVTPIRPSG